MANNDKTKPLMPLLKNKQTKPDNRTDKPKPGAKPDPNRKLGGTATAGPKPPVVKQKTGAGNIAGKPKDKPTPGNKPVPLVKREPQSIAGVTKPGAGKAPNKLADLVDHVTKNYRVTAKEAGDIVKAVSNAGKVVLSNARVNSGSAVKPLVKDVAKQVVETGRAAVTGKSGTTAAKVVPDSSKAAKAWSGNKTYQGAKTVPGKKR